MSESYDERKKRPFRKQLTATFWSPSSQHGFAENVGLAVFGERGVDLGRAILPAPFEFGESVGANREATLSAQPVTDKKTY